jgi:predicted amidohydrolase YtcJ
MDSILLKNANCVDFARKKTTLFNLLIDAGKIKALIATPGNLPRSLPSIDLRRKYVMPGFIDAHTHLISHGIEMQRLDLNHCRSLDECLEKMSAQAKTRDFVFASNWDENTWHIDERENFNRKMLDRISRTKPIIARRVCGHYAVVNTAALRQISNNWKIVDRKHGFLYEDVALNLNDIFPPTDRMLEKALSLAMRKALRLGITSVHEIANPRRLNLLQKHRAHLKVRFAVYLTSQYSPYVLASGLRSGFGDEWLKFAGIKMFADGSVGARTAALRQPYPTTHRRGKLLVTENRMRKTVRDAEENGIQLMIHSIGDRATALVIKNLIEFTTSGNPLRHRLEHLEILDNDAISTIGRLNLIASMQPNFVRRWQNAGGMYERFFGRRYKRMNCFRALLKARAKVVFGSDCMPPGPIYGIMGAVVHPSTCCRLHIADAFHLYTQAGAYATFEELQKGRIAPGFFADLVVLNSNPLNEKNLEHLKIENVFVDGVSVQS